MAGPLELQVLEKSQVILEPIRSLNLVNIPFPSSQMAGRLQIHKGNLLKIIELLFLSNPVQSRIPRNIVVNNKEKCLLSQEIIDMKNKGVIIDVPACKNQFLSNIFLVSERWGPKTSSKSEISKRSCEIPTFHDKGPPRKRGFLLKIDLKEAYSVMSISPKHRKRLRFQWDNKIYQYTSLPFGLGEAPRIFTKTLKPVVGLLRRQGVRLIIYLDDILIMAESREKLRSHRDSTLYLLQKLGYVINWKKSILNLKR